VLLAGAALPFLPHLARAVPTVGLGGVDVQPRASWGGDLKPKGPLSEESPADVRFLLVHHTASGNDYAQGGVAGLLRGFYGFHTTDKGWPDIAYNFLVDRFGRVWEGRTGSLNGPVKGDATGGSQGFALLCCFIGDHMAQPPSAPALDAMGKLLGGLASRHSIDVRPGSKATFVSRGSNLHPVGKTVTTPTIAGHRDMSKTSCPGDACYRLLPSTLMPAAVAAAGLAPLRPPTTPSTSSAIPATPAVPTTAPAVTPTTSPAGTLPATDLPGAPLDTAPTTAVTSPPATFVGAAASPEDGNGGAVMAAGAAAAVAAAGLVALVLRRRGNARETGHWEDARRLDEAE